MESNHTEGFDNETERFLFAAAQVGIEMDQFVRTNPGQYLISRCQEVLDGFSQWVLQNPKPDTTEFERRHIEALAAQMAVKFINEAITDGKAAEESLAELDDLEGMQDGPLN